MIDQSLDQMNGGLKIVYPDNTVMAMSVSDRDTHHDGRNTAHTPELDFTAIGAAAFTDG